LSSKTVTLTATLNPAACVPTNTQVDYGLVKWVASGDTIVVDIRGQLRSVRYLGVQAPSGTVDPANRHTAMVLNRVVRLVRDVSDVDRFGQWVRYVFVDDVFVNHELIRQGLASVVDTPPDQACSETFLQAETQARSQELGIWAEVAMLLPTSTRQLLTPTSLPTLTQTGLVSTGTPTSTQPSSTVSPQTTATQSGSLPTSTATLNPGQPTATYLPTPTGEYLPDLRITNIFYQGTSGAESDEYIEITNNEGFPVNLRGWLLSTGVTGLDLELTNFTLLPGQSCRVYTNMMRPESCGISFSSAQPLWDNEEDCGFLSEPLNYELVDFYCYPPE
jgi:micrococcal nuclease